MRIRWNILLTLSILDVTVANAQSHYLGLYSIIPPRDPQTIALAGASMAALQDAHACSLNPNAALLQNSSLSACYFQGSESRKKNVLPNTRTSLDAHSTFGASLRLHEIYGFGFRYTAKQFENEGPQSNGYPLQLKLLDEEFTPTVAIRLFSELSLSASMVLVRGESETNRQPDSRRLSSQTWSGTALRFSVLYEPTAGLAFSATHRSAVKPTDKINALEQAPQTLSPYKPAQASLAAAWLFYKGETPTSNRVSFPFQTTFLAETDLYYCGDLAPGDHLITPRSRVLSQTQSAEEYLTTPRYVPRLALDSKVLQSQRVRIDLKSGSYFAPATIKGTRGVIHGTAGASISFWYLTLDAGFDFSRDTQTQVYGLRLSPTFGGS